MNSESGSRGDKTKPEYKGKGARTIRVTTDMKIIEALTAVLGIVRANHLHYFMSTRWRKSAFTFRITVWSLPYTYTQITTRWVTAIVSKQDSAIPSRCNIFTK